MRWPTFGHFAIETTEFHSKWPEVGHARPLDGEPLRFAAPVELGVLADGLVPADADDLDALLVDLLRRHQLPLDLVGAVLRERHGLHRHLPHERVAAALLELGLLGI